MDATGNTIRFYENKTFSWSVFQNKVELPGRYESRKLAERALKFGDGPLRRLQDEANKSNGIITDEMMTKLEQNIVGG